MEINKLKKYFTYILILSALAFFFQNCSGTQFSTQNLGANQVSVVDGSSDEIDTTPGVNTEEGSSVSEEENSSQTSAEKPLCDFGINDANTLIPHGNLTMEQMCEIWKQAKSGANLLDSPGCMPPLPVIRSCSMGGILAEASHPFFDNLDKNMFGTIERTASNIQTIESVLKNKNSRNNIFSFNKTAHSKNIALAIVSRKTQSCEDDVTKNCASGGSDGYEVVCVDNDSERINADLRSNVGFLDLRFCLQKVTKDIAKQDQHWNLQAYSVILFDRSINSSPDFSIDHILAEVPSHYKILPSRKYSNYLVFDQTYARRASPCDFIKNREKYGEQEAKHTELAKSINVKWDYATLDGFQFDYLNQEAQICDHTLPLGDKNIYNQGKEWNILDFIKFTN